MMLHYMMMWGSMAKSKVKRLFTDEKGAVDIVAIVVLIGIAVVLALLFKDQIADLIKRLFNQIPETDGMFELE